MKILKEIPELFYLWMDDQELNRVPRSQPKANFRIHGESTAESEKVTGDETQAGKRYGHPKIVLRNLTNGENRVGYRAH